MHLILYILIYPFIWLLSKLPFKVLYFISDCAFIIVYRLARYRKKTVRYNLTTAFPKKTLIEIKEIEKKFYHHLCDIFIEMVKSLSITEQELKKRFQFTNADIMIDFENNNQSVMMMLGHYASYEWMFALQLHLKNPGHALYKVIGNKYFDQLVRNIRGKWRATLVPSKNAMRIINRHKQDKTITTYGFVADQAPKANRANFWTPFLGHELPFQTGAERAAQAYDLPVVFFGTTKVKRGHYKGTFTLLAENGAKTSEGAITSAFAKALEKQILERPELYLWTHKRFKHLGQKEAFFEKYNFKK